MTLVPGSAPDFPFAPAIAVPDPLPDQALAFVFRQRRLLVRKEGERSRVPSLGEVRDLLGSQVPARVDLLYLGSLAGRHAVTWGIGEGEDPPGSHAYGDLRGLFRRLDEPEFWVAGRAVQIVDWHRDHRFCGRCGEETYGLPTERARRCSACQLTAYPRLAPAAIVLVEREGEILLARSPHFVPGVYSTLAGFVEAGESLEQTVVREIEEEVGVRVGNIRYFGSQPWPFPHSLMVGFRADWQSGEIRLEEEEIEAADWFPAHDLPGLPFRASIARSLIDAWLREQGIDPEARDA